MTLIASAAKYRNVAYYVAHYISTVIYVIHNKDFAGTKK